jgi:hypothetical protein
MDVETILGGSAVLIGVSDDADPEIEDAEPLWSAGGARFRRRARVEASFRRGGED